MGRKAQLIRLLHRAGGLKLLDTALGKDRLTVLAYHRICEIGPNFEHFEPNVSASPAMFGQQIAYVAANYNVIHLDQLRAHLLEGQALPPRPLLITFDDGYLDNYEQALPILSEKKLPAVIFIATSRMEDPGPLWWDRCAYLFHHTRRTEADLPLLGQRSFASGAQKLDLRDEMIARLKLEAEDRKIQLVEALAQVLQVEEPTGGPALFMNWDHVRDLAKHDVICQPHTVTHPIMTRIHAEQVRSELHMARYSIEAQLQRPADTFAYPNGMPGDYNEETIRILQEEGFCAAFTLSPGPMRLSEVTRHRYEIRRIFLSHRDSFEVFVAKITGLPALLDRQPYLN